MRPPAKLRVGALFLLKEEWAQKLNFYDVYTLAFCIIDRINGTSAVAPFIGDKNVASVNKIPVAHLHTTVEIFFGKNGYFTAVFQNSFVSFLVFAE